MLGLPEQELRQELTAVVEADKEKGQILEQTLAELQEAEEQLQALRASEAGSAAELRELKDAGELAQVGSLLLARVKMCSNACGSHRLGHSTPGAHV